MELSVDGPGSVTPESLVVGGCASQWVIGSCPPAFALTLRGSSVVDGVSSRSGVIGIFGADSFVTRLLCELLF